MAMDFLLDRTTELARLEDCWRVAASGQPRFIVMWGRRRVGKTFLLSHFLNTKRSVFFGATQQAEGVELARLLEAVTRDLGPRTADLAGGSFSNWEAALRFFAALAEDEPLVVVIDEAPYLTRSTPGFASIVQVVLDHLRPSSKLMLILTGSAFGAIEEMKGPRGPLMGRAQLEMRLDPLSLQDARVFLPRLGPEELLRAYAVCGGYPLHLQAWDQRAGFDANLLRLAFTAGGILLEDATGILREELPDTGGYTKILAAVGCGRSRHSEIAGIAEQRVDAPLEVLTETAFLRKLAPVGAPKVTKPVYEMADTYLAFWFGVLYSDIPQIEAGQGHQVLKRVRARLETQLGRVFEEAARQHARQLVASRQLPDDLLIGRWWASKGPPCEVSVLGLHGSETCLLGEAKWQSQPLGIRELEALRRKVVHVPNPAPEPIYALWGRGGVEPTVKSAGALGFSLEEMLQ